MRNPLSTVAGVLAIAGTLFFVIGNAAVAQAAEPHPHIYNAYRMLRRADYVLRIGDKELGGHRRAARQQVEMALQQLQLAITVDHGTLPPVGESGTPQAPPAELHHHAWMQDALRQCQDAKTELGAASQDLKGHRVKAIQHVDAAIVQLQQAVNYPE
jgi:hypothetical protein